MYKTLVVDDESVVREGIRENIDWNSLGFEFVGDCENGSEAMDAIDRIQPDVVLTDINMPFVDGLELTRNILDKYPRTKVIILTGYDEFEYAQQAVKLKAYDYILKPITANELKKVLEKVKNDLDEEAHKMEDISKLKMQLRESLPLLRERFLNRLVSGHLREETLKDKFDYFNIHLDGSHFLIAVIGIDDYGELAKYHPQTEDELLIFAVFNICEEIFAKHTGGIIFQNNNEKTVAILTGSDAEILRENVVNACEEIRQSVGKHLKFTVTAGIGTVCTAYKDLKHSYKGAVSALDYRFLLGKNRIISISDMEGHQNGRLSYNKEWERKLVLGIKTGTVQEVDGIIGNIILSLKESYQSIDRCYIYIQQIIVSVIDALNELGIGETEMFGQELNPLTEIYKLKTLEEVEVWLRVFCKKASCSISDQRDGYCKVQAMKAEEYIKGNYMNEKISLNALCKHLLMSTSYFSMIFKNFTGETFIEYLTRVRVEKAMELLKGTDMKSYEIAYGVGYSDPHYFSLAFKKATGITPTEYRERM